MHYWGWLGACAEWRLLTYNTHLGLGQESGQGVDTQDKEGVEMTKLEERVKIKG